VMSDSFDRLLARTERRDAAPAGACPDAGMLAAYLDATLTPAERAAVEAHAADCPRCALQLATIVRLEDESGHPRHAPVPDWQRRLFWVVPAATAVVVVAIYVAGPALVRTSAPPPSPAVQHARANDNLVPGPSSQSAQPSAMDSPLAPVEADAELLSTPRERTLPRSAAKVAPSRQTFEDRVDPLQQRAEVAEQKQEPATIAKSRAYATSAPAAPPAAFEAAAKRVSEDAGAADAFAARSIVRSPGGRVLWRTQGSHIERSTDAGRTWSTEAAPAVAGFTMGAAPSDVVCWLAAPSGDVLRRDEAGTWRTVTPSPRRAIARIEAAGSADATVVALDGTVLRTVDGGQHWSEPAR
jgi:hypothetical protein